MNIQDKVIIITGGSQGFGKELAKSFVREGNTVIVSSHNKDNLESTAKELGIDFFLADVTLYEDIQKLGDYVFKKYGKIDYWINNAGIQIAMNLVEDVDAQKAHYLFDVNFFGYLYGCQIALQYMKKQGNGMIININSTAALEGKPQIPVYAASKFAVKGLSESIRKELKDSEIKIYEVFPGGMQTGIYKDGVAADFNEYMKVENVAQKVIDNLKSDNPEMDLIIKRPIK